MYRINLQINYLVFLFSLKKIVQIDLSVRDYLIIKTEL